VNAVRQAYDRYAAIYDDVLGGSRLRSEIWEIADRFFRPGMHLLDLGCGTGDDARHFAGRGLRVTAVDISAEMIARTRLKCSDSVHCVEADMQTYCPSNVTFDGVLCNFSALNHVSDLTWLGRLSLTHGSYVLLTTLGRFYPLESAIFLLKGKPRLAFRRFGGSCVGLIEGLHYQVYYHSLRAIQHGLGPRFELREFSGLRALQPLPDLKHLERFRMLRLLKPFDRWLCSHRWTAACADQMISVWQYR
jgi:SAM-dependent methyltransferase